MGSTAVNKRIRERYALKKTTIKNAIKLKEAWARRTKTKYRMSLYGELVVRGWVIPLSGYTKLSETRKGITLALRKDRGRKLIPHAFIKTMRSGHKGVFIRQRVEEQRAGRLPIEEIFGPSLPAVIEQPEMFQPIEKELDQMLAQRVDHEVGFILDRFHAGANIWGRYSK